MEPVISPGDLIVVVGTDPVSLHEGDIISFASLDGAGLTTHRVVKQVDVNGQPYFQTKGDANDTPDVDLAPGAAVVGRVVLTVPGAGRVLTALGQRPIRALLVLLPAVWLLIRSALVLRAAARAPGVGMLRASCAIAFAAIVVAAASGARFARATLNDTQEVTQNVFSTSDWT